MVSLRWLSCVFGLCGVLSVGCGGGDTDTGFSENNDSGGSNAGGSSDPGGSGGKGGKAAGGSGIAGSGDPSGNGGNAGDGAAGSSEGGAGGEPGGSAGSESGGSESGGSAGADAAGNDAGGSSPVAGNGGAGGEAGGAGGAAGVAGGPAGGSGGSGGSGQAVQSIFIIMMENHSASSIYGSKSAPYFNGTLMLKGAHTTAYKTSIHPSEPNYIWLEAGDNLGITNDKDPTSNKLTTPDHLVSQLQGAGVSWKAYVEDIDGKSCPLSSSNLLGNYGAKHVPQLFFSDTTDSFSASSSNCIAHVRPFADLASDLAAGKAPRYSFIVPNLCNDMHGNIGGCGLATLNEVQTGDDWLKANVPTILNSSAFADGGLLMVIWDEGDEPTLGIGEASDGPLPFVALGSMIKPGYASSVPFSHSSTLKTVEEIFKVPLLRGAAAPETKDLSDLFIQFP